MNQIQSNDCFDKTVLHVAIEKGNVEIIQLLLQHKNIDVNKVDSVMIIELNQISFRILTVLMNIYGKNQLNIQKISLSNNCLIFESNKLL